MTPLPAYLLDEVLAEVDRADAKFGPQIDVPDLDPDWVGDVERLADHYGIVPEMSAKARTDARAKRGTLAWADIAVEELAEAIGTNGDPARLREELIQVVGVGLRWLAALDTRTGRTGTATPAALASLQVEISADARPAQAALAGAAAHLLPSSARATIDALVEVVELMAPVVHRATDGGLEAWSECLWPTPDRLAALNGSLGQDHGHGRAPWDGTNVVAATLRALDGTVKVLAPAGQAGAVLPAPAFEGACPPLTYIGDDGQVLACHGEIDPRLMVCLAIAGWAKDCGPADAVETFLDGSDFDPGGLADVVSHQWVIEAPASPELAEEGHERALWWRDPVTGDPITDATPGAFRITMFDTEG